MLIIKNLENLDQATRELLFSEEARKFLEDVFLKFEPKRKQLLARRKNEKPVLNFLPETKDIRELGWKVANLDSRFEKRIVEITGPANQKTLVNALNSSADVFMADFEDSLTFSWSNILEGQKAIYKAIRKDLEFEEKGKQYKLDKNHTAKLAIRMRGLHLEETNLELDGQFVGGAIFDFTLAIFLNGKTRKQNDEGFWIYIPKLEHYLEARFWKELIDYCEEKLDLVGSTKATVLIETLPAVFQMNEIIWELNQSIAGLNAGRWDYLFSAIKCFPNHNFPYRKKLTMKMPFMMSYCQFLVETCHKRGIHAIGGMSAFIPNRGDLNVTKNALEQVKEDKLRETRLGFDGTWVAHPDLIETAREPFLKFIGGRSHQKDYLPNYQVERKDLLDFPEGSLTEEEKLENIRITLTYIENWLNGVAAVNIDNLMEDVATAEICRIQLKKEDVCLIDQFILKQRESMEFKSEGFVQDFSRSSAILKSVLETRQDFLTLEMSKFL